jgi:hypothetical protein
MKKLTSVFFLLSSLQAFADCSLNLETTAGERKPVRNLRRVERILERKGYTVTNEATATYKVFFDYARDDIFPYDYGLVSLKKNGTTVFSTEFMIVPVFVGRPRSLVKFAKAAPECSELTL